MHLKLFLYIVHSAYFDTVETDQAYKYIFVITSALQGSVAKPPSSGDTKGHKHRFPSISLVYGNSFSLESLQLK
jgi:hypothetical protein